MSKKVKSPMTEKDVQSTWEYLVKQERLLQRNRKISRIIQPMGSLLFLFNLLLATCNFFMFLAGDRFENFFEVIPVLPSLVKSFPRGSWFGVIAFTFFFAYLIPLSCSACVMLICWLKDRKRYQGVQEPLVGSQAQCAKALANKAETVYELKKEIPTWSIFVETGVITVLTALPLVVAMLRTANSAEPAVFQFSLYCLALLVVLFALFWVYALLFRLFFLLNGFLYFSPGEWAYYELYQRADAYWESVDAREYARREHKRQLEEEEKLRKRWLRKTAPAEETAEE